MCSCFYIHVLETLSSAAQTHQHSHAHILLVVVLLNFIQLSSAPIHADYAQPGLYRNTQTRTCAPTHAHTPRNTHAHTQAYASRLFSIQQAFAHCSPRVTRSTSSIPDRLNMERMADEQSQKCIHTHHPQKYVKTQTHFRYSCMQRRTPTSWLLLSKQREHIFKATK